MEKNPYIENISECFLHDPNIALRAFLETEKDTLCAIKSMAPKDDPDALLALDARIFLFTLAMKMTERVNFVNVDGDDSGSYSGTNKAGVFESAFRHFFSLPKWAVFASFISMWLVQGISMALPLWIGIANGLLFGLLLAFAIKEYRHGGLYD